MKLADTKLKKAILIVSGSILLMVVVVIILIAPIAKYLVEKYDEQYSGRKIALGWVYINPFTGYVHISHLKIFESKKNPSFQGGDSIFFSADGVSANFALIKLLSKTIEITEITLDKPRGMIIQDHKELNFSDLIKLFTPEKPSSTPASFHFTILKIHIIDGEFHYHEKLIPINYYIKKVNIESTGKRWNSDTIAAKISFLPGIGTGDVKGDFTINFKTLEYRYGVVIQKFDLNIIQQYIKDLTNNGYFTASLDANLRGRGNFRDPEDMNASGMIAINKFHFGRNPENDIASFDKLLLAIRMVSPKEHQYLFDSVSLNEPFLKYERYDYLDNIQTLIGKQGARISAAASDPAKFNLVIEIARYVKVLAKNFFRSDYQINRLAVYKAYLRFNDFAISEKFSVGLNPLNIVADSIDKNRKWVTVDIQAVVKPYGIATVKLGINPKDSMDFNIQYHLQRLPAALFNPYLLTYTSYPLDRGTIELKGSWVVRNGVISSDNHVVIIDPRRTLRVRNKDNHWLPLPLIMSLVRERGNVIDYTIPITGDLKDPKFHLHDVLTDVIENIFVKPATAGYRLEVRNAEAEIEKSLSMTWGMRQKSLVRNQEKFVNKMVEYLADNPNATINVFPMMFDEKEMEYILFFEARKKYFLLVNRKNARTFTESDSLTVDKMPVKDSLFVRFLDKQSRDTTLYTIQEKCIGFVGTGLIESSYKRLTTDRTNAFLSKFKEKAVEGRVIMHAGENTIPYNGFSFYKVRYTGELPSDLIKAHRKMNDLNNEPPRKQFKNERKKNRL